MMKENDIGGGSTMDEIPEYLYQYTSIEVLALILENKTLRFTSLEFVDDPLEMENNDVKKFGKFAYVSCWTYSGMEKIPFWKMYTNNYGIRIKVKGGKLFNSLKQDPKYLIGELNRDRETDKLNLADEKFILYHKNVKYCENAEDLNIEILKENQLRISDLGERKIDDWQFQAEYRFLFYTIPHDWIESSDSLDKCIKDYNKREFQVPRNIDICVDEKEFEIEEITLGPEVSKAQEIIVRALVEKYGLTCSIVDSTYKR